MSDKAENPNAFKLWINERVVDSYFSDLDPKKIKRINKLLSNYELRGRVRLIADELKKSLSPDYPTALKKLFQIVRKKKMKSFELWPATEFIQINGLDHVEESMQAMYELTSLFTSEFAIRPFLNRHQSVIYKKLQEHLQDPNEHIRRWISEGTRPRLPWGERLHFAVQNPRLGLELIEHLKFDHSLYVRKSVANHLNDIAKDHPELVIRTLTRWRKLCPADYKKEFDFIAQRALRTLIKQGHPKALAFNGVKLADSRIMMKDFKLTNSKIRIGQALVFECRLHNKGKKPEKFVLDYVVYHKKSNGQLSPKVFKLKSGLLLPGEILKIQKKHSFKPVTTRVYYKGEHQIALKVNGAEKPCKNFQLSV